MTRIVTARKPGATKRVDAPEITAAEHQRRGDAADQLAHEVFAKGDRRRAEGSSREEQASVDERLIARHAHGAGPGPVVASRRRGHADPLCRPCRLSARALPTPGRRTAIVVGCFADGEAVQ